MDRKGGPRRLVIAAIIVVILVLIVFVLVATSVGKYENYLSGLWVGDPGFLEKAQLRDMQLFLAPAADGSRQGYLIMTDLSGNFISNQAIEVRVGSPLRRWWTALRSAFQREHDRYAAGCVEVEYDGNGVEGGAASTPMPEQMKMALSILDGTLSLYDSEKVYAFLQKDLVASAAAVEAYSA